jgi:hypothetical protein
LLETMVGVAILYLVVLDYVWVGGQLQYKLGNVRRVGELGEEWGYIRVRAIWYRLVILVLIC